MRDVLVQPQGGLGLGDVRVSPGIIDEAHRQVDRHLVRLGAERPAHVVARRVRPQRQRPADGGVRLGHDAVGVILDVGEERGVRPLAMNQLGDRRGDLARRLGHERAVVGVGRRGHGHGRIGREIAPGTPRTGTAHRHPAVVGRRIAEHVEEQAVDFVALERLGENRQRVLAVVPAVDAGGIEPVVDDRLAVGAHEEPFRMRVEHRLLRLAQVEAADDADLARVRFADDVAEEIAAGGKERAGIVERHLRRVLRDDPAHVHQERVRPEARRQPRRAPPDRQWNRSR